MVTNKNLVDRFQNINKKKNISKNLFNEPKLQKVVQQKNESIHISDSFNSAKQIHDTLVRRKMETDDNFIDSGNVFFYFVYI